jgi:RHS repeat-associated protein
MTRSLVRLGRKALALTVATIMFWAPVVPLAYAQDGDRHIERPVASESVGGTELELSDEELRGADVAPGAAESATLDRGVVTEEAAERIAEHTDAPIDATPISLPGGETRSAISSQAISLPSAEGSIEGMGESFAPVLSSGTATFSVPIAVAPGRAGVQPSLSLAYSSSGGNGPIGFGWGMGVPFISRQTDRGLPRYVDRAAYHGEEDRFIYNGGQELVPVDTAAMAVIDQTASPDGDDAGDVPSDVVGWQQYRARVEGGFMRFFRAPPSSTGRIGSWVVQSKDGTRFDFGLLPTGEGPPELAGTGALSSLEVDSEGGNHVFRWMLTRMSDAHGSTVYYSYRADQGQLYVSDIHYVSPHSCGVPEDPDATRACAAALSSYAARIHFVYESRQDAFSTYTSGWRVATALRLQRVEVTAYEDSVMRRTLVRRYHLRYQTDTFHSLLHSVQVEGRPSTMDSDLQVEVGDATVPESSLNDRIVGALLPPMTFGYSELPDAAGAISGFGGLSNSIHTLSSSPPSSIDEARSDFFDVNSDGLPDYIVTDPARYRTADGDPAVGVFFNGFSGTDARPGTAGEFSGAVPMAMRSDLSGVLSLSNLNIVPMDMDGDGRTDLLHMPRVRSYGWFTPTREADVDGAPASVSPADQGWRWTYATIDLPASDTDPRIDFGRDGEHFQTVDVNNDHLIDVVRTTGTVMQTWLNLGWVPVRDSAGRPAGDGRFGNATYDGSTWRLSTAPVESCLLQAGTPLDFEDPEARLADMNGDGLVDLVRVRRGRVIWWPGRGLDSNGAVSWGNGPRDCSRGDGAERYVEMATPPAELNVDLAGVQLADVDGDGATDIVQVRFDAVDVWFNRAGQSFTSRFVVRSTPAAPDFAPRVRVMDIDGSGTVDIVYANGGRWQYVDLLARTQPRMLTTVDNGLGALTTIGYGTSATDYLADLAAARTECTDESTGCDRFVWSRVEGEPSARLQRRAAGEPPEALYHSGGSPVISTVVRSIETSDRFGVYSEDQISETRFAYHEGYYEGIEQEFRGFGAADSLTVGETTNPSVLTRTWFHQGRRAQDIADDRLEWNPDEALKGREYLTEVLDERGHYLSSAHATLTSRTLATGRDGRPIQYAFVSQADEIRYDTTDYTPLGATVTLPDVVREAVDDAGNIDAPMVDRNREVFVRGDRGVMIETTYDEVDNLGQVHAQTAHGRVEVPGTILPWGVDPEITSETTPVLVSGSRWLWRTLSSHVLGGLSDATGAGSTPLRATTNRYSAVGDLLATTQDVTTERTYLFAGEDSNQGGAEGLTQVDEDLVASSVVDSWGQAVASCVADDIGDVGAAPSTVPEDCFRFATVAREDAFDQLAESETAFTGRDPGQSLTTQGTWDRGLGVLLTATDPNTLATSVTYDGLGRMTSVTPPEADGCGVATPTTRIHYELTSTPGSQPVSRVVTTTELDCDGSLGESNSDGHGALVSIGYVDGLGRVRATLATGGEDAAWVRAGVTDLDRKGAVYIAWQADFFDASDTSYTAVLAFPSSSLPHTRSVYDAFGRVVGAYAEDNSLTMTSYHTLSTDVCDPLDNDPEDLVNGGTCTTARTDGHGRLMDQVLRYRADGLSETEHHRLWTYYRNDGAVLALVRAQEADSTLRPSLATAVSAAYPHVHRVFVYDSVGRRIGSDDPDTDDPTSMTAGSRTWRYLFNRAGDLAAVRDPRGCGQNFYYDVGGRLLGEQYVRCFEALTTQLELPIEELTDAVGMDPSTGTRVVDVHYFYDTEPDWVASATLDFAPPSSPPLLGRATGVADRAQRAAVSYDARGNAVWTGRQIAVISSPVNLGFYAAAAYPIVQDYALTTGNVVYDDDHTYVRTAAFDHAGRPVSMALPRDPDWDSMAEAPLVRGLLDYDSRGLPANADLVVGEGMDATTIPVVSAIHYLRDGLVDSVDYGDIDSSPVVHSATEYDDRRRPTQMSATRSPTGMDGLEAVTEISNQTLVWDAASNLTEIRDVRDPNEWDAGFRPASVTITHDSLYRVVGAMFDYSNPGDDPETVGGDEGTDWRSNAGASENVDPMRPEAAPMVSSTPPDRVQALVWSWDWLGNMTEWTDDAQQFYERSIGDIGNGYDVGERPSALYLASNLDAPSPYDRGWVELDYGVGGNVRAVTVHAQCDDAPMETCADPGGDDRAERLTALRAGCACAVQQYFQYRWDELNRIAEARRFDRAGTSNWTMEARQRYRYDGANVRVIKESFDVNPTTGATNSTRVALYVYPGDFERRGVERDGATYAAGDPMLGPATETQYMVAGARVVWDNTMWGDPGDPLDVGHRVAIPVSDLLHTTAATVDLMSGELLEVCTYYPNGARETLLVDGDLDPVPLDPTGFTGKEADEDVGLVYFGERYLLARLGRWASPDPIHVHASGGGEALNSYHYVSGNLLQSRDPLGLQDTPAAPAAPDSTPTPTPTPPPAGADVILVPDEAMARAAGLAGDIAVSESRQHGQLWAAAPLPPGSPPRAIVELHGSDPASIRAALEEARQAAGEGGSIIISVGHGGTEETLHLHVSGFQIAPAEEGWITTAVVGLHEDPEEQARMRAQLVDPDTTAEHRAEIAAELARLASYEAFLTGLGRGTSSGPHPGEIYLLTCNVGQDEAFLQSMADATQADVIAHDERVWTDSHGHIQLMSEPGDVGTVELPADRLPDSARIASPHSSVAAHPGSALGTDFHPALPSVRRTERR